MLSSFLVCYGLLISLSILFTADSYSVNFDGRAFIINGERRLLIGGSIHYPRAPRAEWPGILKAAKDSGLDLIQTYVFWDIHEPEKDVWNFPSDPTSSHDLVAFIQEAAKQDLLVHLRIAGYICAEWNFGGLPGWLRDLNATLRTNDPLWLEQLSQFVEKTLDVVDSVGLFAKDGGPIVMLQIENEYGNMEDNYGNQGHEYVSWLSNYANSLNFQVPWVMCQQGEGVGTAPAKEIVNACNGFYCDNWISQHTEAFPNQPHMFTELWPGWFQNWGEPIPHRPAVDVAFSVARWFARGGSYVNYYMAFGGSTFGRSVGGPLIVTSYDYDVQINEYGLVAEPKYTLLQQLHSILHAHQAVLVTNMPPVAQQLAGHPSCESHTYTAGGQCLAFWSNWGEMDACTFTLSDSTSLAVPAWSVTITSGAHCTDVIFNTKTTAADLSINEKVYKPVKGFTLHSLQTVSEPVPSSQSSTKVQTLVADVAQEQLSVTHDSTDYLWYSTKLPAYATATKATLQFSSGTAGGGVFHVFVNGQLAASVLGKAGGNPIVQGALKAVETVKVAINVPAGASAALDILSVSMGLQNYGPYLETMQVGIVSDLSFDGKQLHNITHSVGLVGEAQRAFDGISVPMLATAADSSHLTWHTLSFATPSSVTARSHLALDLSMMGKGAVWVNGNMLGRYWNATAIASVTQRSCYDCPSADYVGSYNGDKCRSGCGQPSQQYYKLPTEWLVKR